MQDLFRLDGKVAAVIGGAGGIGKALALGMSQYGAKVAVASRNREALEEAAREISAATGGEVRAYPADVTDEASTAALVEAVVGQWGGVDILINASGLNIKRPPLDYPVEDWDRIFDVNVKGTMIACKFFGRAMKERGGGRIINMSSVRGIRGFGGGNIGYCGTKGAVELITKSMAIELAPENIRVNALGPALIITPGTAHVLNDPARAERTRAQIPLGKLGQPEDLIGAAVFLASDASAFITGQTIYVDGGLTAS